MGYLAEDAFKSAIFSDYLLTNGILFATRVYSKSNKSFWKFFQGLLLGFTIS